MPLCHGLRDLLWPSFYLTRLWHEKPAGKTKKIVQVEKAFNLSEVCPIPSNVAVDRTDTLFEQVLGGVDPFLQINRV